MGGSGREPRYTHKMIPKLRNKISIVIGNTKNAVVEKVIRINEIALFFALRLKPLYFCQSFTSGPNTLWFKIHDSNFFEDLEKAHAEIITIMVVGIPGRKAPIKPSPKKTNPMER